jgi:hypothetical protein
MILTQIFTQNLPQRTARQLTNTFVVILFTSLLFSCSSTDSLLSDKKTITYYDSSFEKTVFSPITSVAMKKPLGSDHQLMMALLNRPITADQAMMLAFTQQRADKINPVNSTASLVNYVDIKGEKMKVQQRPTNLYSTLIAKDINAIKIMAPL